MNTLKLKLNLFEKHLVMQVIDQAEFLTGNLENPIEFTASNGITIVSQDHPSIDSISNKIYLRGQDKEQDFDICVTEFESTDRANDYLLMIKSAIVEFINSIKLSRVNPLLHAEGEIDLGSCRVLVRYLKNGFVFQLLYSNIKKPNSNVHINSRLYIKVLEDGAVDIYLPFCSYNTQQEIVVTEKIEAATELCTEDIVRNVLLSLIDYRDYSTEVDYPESILVC